MMYNDKISVPFEDEMNRSIRTEVTDNLLFQNHELPPFDEFFFGYYFPFFIIQEVKCNEPDKKNTLDFKLGKMGRARYVFYWTHQILVY